MQDINKCVTSVSDYINFCLDSVIPTISFYVYSSDKPQGTVMKQLKGTYRHNSKDKQCWINMTINKK